MAISSVNRRRAADRALPHRSTARETRGGFAMMEVVLALVILGLLASLGLPLVRTQTGATALRSKAFEIVAMMRTDRNAAIASGLATTVFVDERTRRIRSGRTQAEIVLPTTMSLALTSSAAGEFRFFPDGRASEGTLALVSGRDAVRIAVSGSTALVAVAEAPIARR